MPPCGKEVCTTVAIVDDDIAEDAEMFYVTVEITPGLDPRIKIIGITRATVNICDNDGKCID